MWYLKNLVPALFIDILIATGVEEAPIEIEKRKPPIESVLREIFACQSLDGGPFFWELLCFR